MSLDVHKLFVWVTSINNREPPIKKKEKKNRELTFFQKLKLIININKYVGNL